MPDHQKKNKLHQIAEFFVILVTIILISTSYYTTYKSDKIIQEKKVWARFFELQKMIEDKWKYAALEDLNSEALKSCPYLKWNTFKDLNIGEKYYQCNADFIRCFIEYGDYKKDADIKASFLGLSSPVVDGKPYAAHIGLQSNRFLDVQMNFFLEDSCSASALPERVYATGPASLGGTDKDWRFDTFERKYWIDKYLVSNREVSEWLRYTSKEDNQGFYKKVAPLSATGLTPEQMRQFCAFRGKQLLDSHILDAGSFLPSSFHDSKPIVNLRHPYPWRGLLKNNFLYKAKKNQKVELSADDCKKAYILECQSVTKRNYYSNEAMSWIGLNDVLGGTMEFVRNSQFPEMNVRPSNEKLTATSEMHQIGMRISWSEELASEVGFRCMKFEGIK